MPVKRSANSFCCFTWINGVDLRYGSTADQGRTEEKIPPLGCGAQHEHQAPTRSKAHQLGTARWACVRAGKCVLTPRPHFTAHHARLATRWLLLRTALLFVRSAVRLVYAELRGVSRYCSGSG